MHTTTQACLRRLTTLPSINLQNFVVQEVVGSGGYSQVSKAIQKNVGTPSKQFVALKRFRKEAPESSSLPSTPTEQFLAEKEVLSRVRSPFIVGVHGVAEDDSSNYLALEYQGGGDLFDLIAKMKKKGCASQAGGIEENLARFHAAETLLGLEDLHANDIVWCDLKPENIIFNGTDGHLKLADFGTALDIPQMQQTRPKKQCYTLEYMAPELVDEQSFDASADLWSFGVLLFELLVGESPFRSGWTSVTTDRIRRIDFEPARVFNRDARDLIKRLLVADPLQRPSIPEIKAHPFFKSIDWDALVSRELAPPIPSWAENFYLRQLEN